MTEPALADPILAARVDALDQNLQRVTQSLQLIDRLHLDAELRKKVSWQVERLVQTWGSDLGKLKSILAHGCSDEALVKAWSRYQQLEDNSQELFSGCLELIGGCAFRQSFSSSESAAEEAQVWAIADRLIVEAAVDLNGSRGEAPYLTVPALQEALSMSRVRTIRMRFPEWTVWTLPLLAFDFGHVAITEYRVSLDTVESPLLDVLEAQIARDLEHDRRHQAKLAAAGGDEVRDRMDRRADKWARHRIRVLLADALATHWMGPAYACAAVHLRFDPSSAFTGSPSYDERSRLVIGRLRGLAPGSEQVEFADRLEREWNEAVERADPPRHAVSDRAGPEEILVPALEREWSEPVERADPPRHAVSDRAGPEEILVPALEREWNEAVERADPPRHAVSDRAGPEEILVPALDGALGDLPQNFRFGKARWLKASLVQTNWEEIAKPRKKLPVPAEKLALRDVLNAVWLTRLANPALVEELSSVAVSSCGTQKASR